MGKVTEIRIKAFCGSPEFNPKEAVFVGDRLDSDIAFANANGIPSVLVETGVNKRTDVKEIIPSFIVENLSQLLPQ